MTGSFFFRFLRGLPRFVFWTCLAVLAGLALLRGVVWAMGTAQISDALTGPPQITRWQVEDPAFGGMSALLMAPDGARLVAGGDHGTLVEAQIRRDAAGQIIGFGEAVLTPLMLPGGPAPDTFKVDFEALTRNPDGGWFTALEGVVRIERLARPGARPRATHDWDRFVGLFGNQAFEALATLPDGRVIAITEPQVSAGQAGSAIYDGLRWRQGPKIPVRRGYNITGADVGPDGCLYLLARRYGARSGFTFTLRRISGGPGAWVETPLYVSAPARLGNAEGLSVWQDPAGHLVLSVITDNGFWPGTPTRLIEMRTAPGTGCTLTF